MEEGNWAPYCGATPMSDHSDDRLGELEVAEPSLKRLSLPRVADSGGGPEDSGVHQRDPLRGRVRGWTAGSVKGHARTDWLRLRFLPWLGDQTTRGTRAAHAFWSALEPAERERVWDILERFRGERGAALRSLGQGEVAQISGLVYRGLLAARQAWRGD